MNNNVTSFSAACRNISLLNSIPPSRFKLFDLSMFILPRGESRRLHAWEAMFFPLIPVRQRWWQVINQ